MNERPIIFTIIPLDNGNYRVYTRSTIAGVKVLEGKNLYPMILGISQDYNNNGYAVLFEVDWYGKRRKTYCIYS